MRIKSPYYGLADPFKQQCTGSLGWTEQCSASVATRISLPLYVWRLNYRAEWIGNSKESANWCVDLFHRHAVALVLVVLFENSKYHNLLVRTRFYLVEERRALLCVSLEIIFGSFNISRWNFPNSSQRKQSRRNYNYDTDDIIEGKRTFSVEEKLNSPKFTEGDFVQKLTGDGGWKELPCWIKSFYRKLLCLLFVLLL